jgi:hypothetical protein
MAVPAVRVRLGRRWARLFAPFPQPTTLHPQRVVGGPQRPAEIRLRSERSAFGG